jgi:ATP-dependent phosphofructokinase / diphosphate-dependent phosphofructokinase
MKSKTKCICILTSGGDCPGPNAAIRGVVKAATGTSGIKMVGFAGCFRGLVRNRTVVMDDGGWKEDGHDCGGSRKCPETQP